MKQASITDAKLEPLQPCLPDDDPRAGRILGAILAHYCALDSNAQLYSHVLSALVGEHLFTPPMWSSEHLAELNGCDIWRTSLGYGFIDKAIELHRKLGWPGPWNPPNLNVEPGYFELDDTPGFFAQLCVALHVDVLKFFNGLGRDVFGGVLADLPYSSKRAVRNNTLLPCTSAEREELYRLRAHLLGNLRTVLPEGWCLSNYHLRVLAAPNMLFTDTSRCVHGLMSFGQCMAGELSLEQLLACKRADLDLWRRARIEGELIEMKVGCADILRGHERLIRTENCPALSHKRDHPACEYGTHQIIMRPAGEKDSDDSLICAACERGFQFTTAPLHLLPSQDQERWTRVRPKGSRKVLSDRWGLATGTHCVASGRAAEKADETVKEVTVNVRKQKPRHMWVEAKPTPQLAQTRALLLRPESLAFIARQEQYLLLNMPPPCRGRIFMVCWFEPDLINGVSFVPHEIARLYCTQGPVAYGDYDPLPSEPKWLTERNAATRYVKALKPQGPPPADVFEGYGPVASLWCEKCIEYVGQDHPCAPVAKSCPPSGGERRRFSDPTALRPSLILKMRGGYGLT